MLLITPEVMLECYYAGQTIESEEIILAGTAIANIHMTFNEASEKYPDSYIVMQSDSLTSDSGTVLYVCDTKQEAYIKMKQLEDLDLLGVTTGVNHHRSLGGIVIGG